MKEIIGDIWDFHDKGHWIVITTNGTVKKDGSAVMGRGIALQAANKFPRLAFKLGKMITEEGNCLHHDSSNGLIFFPVKYNWREKASLELIEISTEELVDLFDNHISGYPVPIYMVRPGCGNGGLNWGDVKPLLEKYLDDRFTIVQRRSHEFFTKDVSLGFSPLFDLV